jgi:hypothetical protein
MTRSKRVRREVGKFSNSATLGIAGLVFLLGSGLSWAGGPPNPTPSDAQFNTAGGANALFGNQTGSGNTAFGEDALAINNKGDYNTATGYAALLYNTTGSNNTASGYQALFANTTGALNAAFGAGALLGNNGNYNTATGYQALSKNDTGSANTASGYQALIINTTGSANTASGFQALYNNNGELNAAFGDQALIANTTGIENTAVGSQAGMANTAGSSNTFIGSSTDANAGTYTNGTALGFNALLTASNSIVLGNTSISKIYAQVSSITAISDRRRKKDITALDTDLGLDFIEKLKPVSYRFNNGDETERYGFVAQDLEQALPAALHDTIERSDPEHRLALIERQNDEDRTYRVSYSELTAPMVKAIQQQQQEIEAMRHALAAVEHQVSALKAENAALRHSIRGQREQVTAAR